MKDDLKNSENSNKRKNREGEKGAAMVMILLVSLLLLTASAGLLLEASLNTTNVTDSVAELQAYNAAESGIQSAVNVLRGNVAPNPLIDGTKPATHVNNRIDFRKAVSVATSNAATDTGTTPRFSRWLSYNYTPSGAPNPERVTLSPGTYDPLTGYAFSVSVSDPDNTGSLLSYSTSGTIDGATASKTFGSGLNTATITYVPVTVTNLNVSTGIANTNLGNFVITTAGLGGAIAADQRFDIAITMSKPYVAMKMIRGTIKAGAISPTSVNGVRIEFDSTNHDFMGSMISILNLDADKRLTPNPPSTNAGVTTVNITTTPAEPQRLLIRSVGYGPRGARKQLEAIIQKNFFGGLSAPATLTMVGTTSGFHFDAGQSQNVTYSGDDVVTNVIIPSIGTTNSTNLAAVQANLTGGGHKANIIGIPANVNVEIPDWLKTAKNLDDVVQALRDVAEASGRYYPSGVEPSDFGNNFNATGITFVDGDVSLARDGGGILVCTGKLTLDGAFKFNGLIIVTGAGGVDRRGGGNGLLQGNVVVAPYTPDNIAAGFLAPKYDITGGGNSEIRYNSSSVANGMTAVSNFVLGVAEK
jgi:hypothetical protein